MHPMTELPVPRPSACPGLLRIVQALDGGICRVKLPGGVLAASQARAIAEAAQRFASGVLELTNRSNLQIRGVRAESEQELIRSLLEANLGPSVLDADDVRNLMLSPAAGLDPQQHMDTRPLADALLALLQNNSALHVLSAKFAIQLDGGESLCMLEHPHDLWLRALPGAPQLIFGLAGCPTDKPLGMVAAANAVQLVEAILLTFLECAVPEQSRMRQLLECIPADELVRRVQARLPFAISPVAVECQRQIPAAAPPIGIIAQRQAELAMVAASAPLGRISAEQLGAVAELAQRHADGSLRLTPWQGLLIPNVQIHEADNVLAALTQVGLLTNRAAPLPNLIACTGSAGCARGLADTKHDALALAACLQQHDAHPQVHLSGCSRSCAAAHVAPFTLLAVGDGLYQLYERAANVAGFGQPLAPPMNIDEAGAWLAQHHATGRTHA
ncbi:precorrin-3B synthase [Stutzerimonas zhaodongensis]|uniref:Precorrin-3B synthase n=1 Tax=Stutzerimonas zhaodongensis TaxID=1176257 RepID=A0A3M2HVS5_9GAMM|nr:precorrin-3B synthase [Stutzerimonas zhaodongensis]MCQ4317022.1 precorrin-3B synthase [Stutzerimonas zhaodongensis]RMH91760.1 precorrin-3B synthase [Stutzerimonas zhaodongensis]